MRADNYPDAHGLLNQLSMPQYIEWLVYQQIQAEQEREARLEAGAREKDRAIRSRYR